MSVIASITSHFCVDCNCLHVTTDTKDYTCLFSRLESGIDLKPLRDPKAETDDRRIGLSSLLSQRFDRYSEERDGKIHLEPLNQSMNSRSEMACLGGLFCPAIADISISFIPLNTRIRPKKHRIYAISNGAFPICI